MGDRVAVMSKGVLQQVDAPQRLYDRPANLFVAGFIGTPPMNLLEATVVVERRRRRSTLGGNDARRSPTRRCSAYPRLRELRRPQGDRRAARRRPASRRRSGRPADDPRARRAGRVARRRVDGVLPGRRARRARARPPTRRTSSRRDGERDGRRRRGRTSSRRSRRTSSSSSATRSRSPSTPTNLHFFDEAIGCAASLARPPSLPSLRWRSSRRPARGHARGRRRRRARRSPRSRSRRAQSLARVAAHLLRDDRPVRERRPVERHAAGSTGGRGATGFDPTDTGYYHGGDLKGLTGGCTDPCTGSQRIKDLGFTAIWVTPPSCKQDPSQGGSAGYHGYWGLDFTTRRPAPRHRPGLRRPSSPCAHSLGLKVIPRRRRQPHRRRRPARRRLDVHRRRRTATATASSFNPARYVDRQDVPVPERARTCRDVPFVLAGRPAREEARPG